MENKHSREKQDQEKVSDEFCETSQEIKASKVSELSKT